MATGVPEVQCGIHLSFDLQKGIQNGALWGDTNRVLLRPTTAAGPSVTGRGERIAFGEWVGSRRTL